MVLQTAGMSPDPIDPGSRVVRASDAVWREIDGRATVISLDEGRIRTMNPTGSFVWQLLDGAAVASVLDRLAGQFPGVARDAREADLGAFVRDLAARGLVRILPPDAA